jgi:hypothetical protein
LEDEKLTVQEPPEVVQLLGFNEPRVVENEITMPDLLSPVVAVIVDECIVSMFGGLADKDKTGKVVQESQEQVLLQD